MKKLILLMLILVGPIFSEEIELPKGICFRHISTEFFIDFTVKTRTQNLIKGLTYDKIYLQNNPMPLAGIESVNYTANAKGEENVEITLNKIGQKYILSVGTTPLILGMIFNNRVISYVSSTERGVPKKVLNFSGAFEYEIEIDLRPGDPWTGPSEVNKVRKRPKLSPKRR